MLLSASSIQSPDYLQTREIYDLGTEGFRVNVEKVIEEGNIPRNDKTRNTKRVGEGRPVSSVC